MKNALWLLGAGLVLLAITITATLITIRIERPAAAVTQSSCTVTTARTVRG